MRTQLFGLLRASSMRGALIVGLLSVTPTIEAGTSPESCKNSSGLPSDEGEKAGMVFVPGGSFAMGSDREHPEERFSHVVRVDDFWIDRNEVTNAQFKEFVKATGYVSLAERGLDPKTHPSMSEDLTAPGSVLFIQPTKLDRGGDITQWWQYVKGAN